MLSSYLNAMHSMETLKNKKMMSKIDENVEQMYEEFECTRSNSPSRSESSMKEVCDSLFKWN